MNIERCLAKAAFVYLVFWVSSWITVCLIATVLGGSSEPGPRLTAFPVRNRWLLTEPDSVHRSLARAELLLYAQSTVAR